MFQRGRELMAYLVADGRIILKSSPSNIDGGTWNG
jgi:hypothetical protein